VDRTIVFIHGAWVTPLCWEPFSSYFQNAGYQTVSPAWPGKESPVEQQRHNPSEQLLGLGVESIVAHYASIIEALPQTPILVGRSFGGLFVQILLDRGIGSCGVAIDPAPPRGVFAFYPTAFRSLGRVLTTWKGWNRILTMPFTDFEYFFLNKVPAAQRRSIYDSQVVPETGRIFFEAALAPFSPRSPTRVNFGNRDRASLLIVAGGSDHIVPPQVNRSNFKKQLRSARPTAFREFPARGHWIIAQEGWEEVAAHIRAWLSSVAGAG
jgi:pimeloyl-ACP methyl ester carboxylesterase